jgi:Ca-activated chloride channel family protein
MKTMKSRKVKMAALLCVAAIAALHGGRPVYGAGMLVADGGFGGKLEIKEHTVGVTVNNGIAVTRVRQVFQNTENRQVEALYTFPVPAKASVANFSMWINGKEMVGEVVEKQRAREIYDSYKRQRRDPGLLEQADFKTFEMRIFPIGPMAEQRIEIAYYQELDFDHEWATYVYPLATQTERGPDTRVEGKFGFNFEVNSEVPIVAMESPSHADDFAIANHSSAFYEASLEKPNGSLARDIVVAYHVSRPHTGIDIVTSKTGQEDGYFYLTMTPGEELAGAASGMDYVFILDISGSMASESKLQVSSDLIAAFVDQLGEDDRFEVMTFNNQPGTHFNELRAASDEARTDAARFINSQRARGGTVLQSALRAAYNYADAEGDRMLNLVILSDGITQVNDQSALLDASGSRPKTARVFCLGVGNEVNKPLLSQLAEQAGGLAAFISRGDDFDRQAQAFRRKLTRPIATDLQIDIAGIEVYDVLPKQLPNLYHGMPVRMYGRYRGDGAGAVQLRADVEGRDLNQEIPFVFPVEESRNPEIERMWALQKVRDLGQDNRTAGGKVPSREAIREIVRLGEGYSIVTEYTSFLVLENDGEYQRWKIERKNALRLARDRKAQEELREELNTIRMRDSAQLGPAGSQQLAKADPPSSRTATPQPSQAPGQPHRDRRNIDIRPQSASQSGGGAIDPISGGLVLGLGALALARRRRSSAE